MTDVTPAEATCRDDRDQGAVLLLVLAVAIVLSLIVLALANFVAADLRYSHVVDARAETLLSAESGIDYAVDRLRQNQTVCTSKVADATVDLNARSPFSGPVAGTTTPAALNGTDTRVTCQRLDSAYAPFNGWALVLSDFGTPFPDQLRVNASGTAEIDGPVFVPYPNSIDTDIDSHLTIVDGDLWYTDSAGCSSPMDTSDLSIGPTPLTPEAARGPVCTRRSSPQLFSVFAVGGGPPVPALPSAVNPPPDTDSYPGCRVFSPGRYTSLAGLGLGTNMYFKSGNYVMDFDVEAPFANAVAWFGRPEPSAPAPAISNLPCVAAMNADDPGVNGYGATLYFDRASRISIGPGGRMELFPRQQGTSPANTSKVSIQALPTSTTGNFVSLLRTSPSGLGDPVVDLLVHGLVWAPSGRIELNNNKPGSRHVLGGGVVTGRLWIDAVDLGDPDNFEIRPAKGTAKTKVLLTSTSTTSAGVTTTVEAVVEYRPDAPDPAQRVAVSSLRVVD